VSLARSLALAVVPPLCAACGHGCRPEEVVCGGCARRLAATAPLSGRGPAGTDSAWSSAAHEGVARELVAALKFRRLLPVAALMAERIEWLSPAGLLSGAIVPVPTSRARSLLRGFDPAAELARALAARTGLPLAPVLRRHGGGRQLGRSRGRRLSDPPRILLASEAPRSTLLVDDVLTTGATLAACARALRAGGAARVAAVTFSRRL
jgi:predicted amidophosphoribosyltransferase